MEAGRFAGPPLLVHHAAAMRDTTTHTPDEVRHCIKCGREIGADASICPVCNRAGMATPSASQYHGTVVVAIVLAVVGLAIAASLSLRGVGPYAAELRGIEPADPGYTISYVVTNEGTAAGRAKCRITARAEDGRQLRVRNTLTAQIPGGETTEATETIPGLEVEPASVVVRCS
jgi:RNA polymerase subunit RPABC4/transcription elongation factor Spt4